MNKFLVFNILSAAIANGKQVVLHVRNLNIRAIRVNVCQDWDFVCSFTKIPELTIGTVSGNRYCLEKEFKSYDNIVSIEIL